MGRFVNWTGGHAVSVFVRMQIHRRKWAIRQLIQTMEKLSVDERGKFISRHSQKVSRASADLLELSEYVLRLSCSNQQLTSCCIALDIARLCSGLRGISLEVLIV